MPNLFNRRTFLKRTAAAGTSAVATASLAKISHATAPQQNPTVITHPSPNTSAPNKIVAENSLPGTPNWLFTKLLGDIEGYASLTSATAGETVRFFVNTAAKMFDLLVYRTGYYGGVGARLVQEVRGLNGTTQAHPKRDPTTGLASAAHWVAAHELVVPTDWVSGIYVIKLVRPDTGGEACIYLVIRDDANKSQILLQQSVSTYQAYNNHGGKSLYHFNSDACQTLSEGPRAVAVSLDRPYSNLLYWPNHYFVSDYPLVYWLEAQGYDVSYCTSMDTHNSGKNGETNQLLSHAIFLSVGHDEYWSQEMRTAMEAARDAGVHLGFFSANTGYWRVRFENDAATGRADRTMVCYKTTESGAADPISPTGTWRDPTSVNQPENALTGMMYVGDNDTRYFPLRVSATEAKDKLYRHTPLANLQEGAFVYVGHRLLGWEWEAAVDNGHTPSGLQILARSPVYGNALDDFGRTYAIRKNEAHVSRYVAPSGSVVFNAGTNQWAWGLAFFDADPNLQQMTCNIFADMGAQPATPSRNLVLDTSSIEQTARHEYNDGMLQPAFDVLRKDFPNNLGTVFAAHTPATPQRDTDPQITNVQFVPSTNNLEMSWQTDVPTVGQFWLRLAPKQVQYKLRADLGWAMPVAGVGVSEPFATQHRVTAPFLDAGRTYFATLVATDEHGRVTILPEQEVTTAQGSAINTAMVALRTAWRTLPCWLSDKRAALSAATTAGLGVLASVVLWRVRRAQNAGAKRETKTRD